MSDKVCSKCRKTKSLDHFISHINGSVTKLCDDCRRRSREFMRRIPTEERTLKHKEWRKGNGRHKVYVENYNLKKNAGLTVEEYEALSDKQNGLCAICQKEAESTRFRRMHVDHDHKTGKIRGLLCQRCNTGLGLFMDDIDTLKGAIAYLESCM